MVLSTVVKLISWVKRLIKPRKRISQVQHVSKGSIGIQVGSGNIIIENKRSNKC